MDDKDLEILQLLRRGFPLVQNPWKEIGDKIWIDEMSVISRLASLLQQGVIRYLGPFFDSRRLGYTGALMGIDVVPDQIPAAISKARDRDGDYIIQEFVEGPNISIEVVSDGSEPISLVSTESVLDENYDCKMVVSPFQERTSGRSVILAR